MCGRYSINEAFEIVAEYLRQNRVKEAKAFMRRVNISPGTKVPIIRRPRGEFEVADVLWKLIPPWAADPRDVKVPTINARSETVREKPSYRHAWKTGQRCLVPASGWFEFPNSHIKGKKQPVWFSAADGKPFCFAGIWEHWERPVGQADQIDSMAILTCEPNATVARFHDRMPVLIARENYDAWLDPSTQPDEAYALLQPQQQTLPLNVWHVTPRAGRVDYQEEDAIMPVEPERPRETQMDLF